MKPHMGFAKGSIAYTSSQPRKFPSNPPGHGFVGTFIQSSENRHRTLVRRGLLQGEHPQRDRNE